MEMRQQRTGFACAIAAVVVLTAGACGRPAPPSAAPAPGAATGSAPGAAGAVARTDAATTPEWEAIVAAAKQEGALVISTHTGASTFQRLHERIKQQFPWL